MRAIPVLMILAWVTSAHAQTLEQQERLHQADKFMTTLDELISLTDKFAKEKKTHCMMAINNDKVWQCLASSLPVVIKFVEYVSIVNQTKEALEYDKQTEDDKKIIDNTRAARDKCVATRQ